MRRGRGSIPEVRQSHGRTRTLIAAGSGGCSPAVSAPDGRRNILIERRVDNQRTRHIVLLSGMPGRLTYSGLAR
jgi:hypothetical protein